MRVVCDEHGNVRGFRYHDGYLDGVLVSDHDRTVHVALRSIDGERRLLTLHGVTRLHVRNVCEGNIVCDLRMLRADQVAADEAIREQLTARYKVPGVPDDMVVFEISSSYGAELLAICQEAEISDVGVTLAVRSTIP